MTTDDSGVLAGKKILPKPKELMPGVEAREEALVQSFNPQGLSPHIDADDPDVQAAQSEYEQAQAKLKATVQRKSMLKLAQSGDTLDPGNVAAICEKEPWKSGHPKTLQKSLLGFVPEKFEAAALRHPEGSEERTRLMAAHEQAKEIYMNQMKGAVRHIWAEFEQDRSVQNKRALSEPVSMRYGEFARSLQENPVYEQPYGRVMWVCLQIGQTYMRKYKNNSGLAKGDGYQQYVLKPSEEPDDPSPV